MFDTSYATGLVNGLIDKAKKIQDGLDSGLFIKEIIEDSEVTFFILNANTQEQLFEEGIDRVGVSIMDYAPYRPITIEFKQFKNQPYNRVTLRDTGEFHRSFYIKVDDTQFEIKASDEKTDSLIKKYGRQILGLTDENLEILIRQYIFPMLNERIRNEFEV
ncbi:MAG: hypothetical protein LBP67_05005 [Bacteroidales bacterium]|jgi:hypothetical protein|nr:hypothetical protein [Bacteroidales bacterium]